jgi:radical SAM superfamily enzyme YgiQ (UPF0313 family)
LRAFEELPSSLYFGAGGTGPAESLGRRVLYVGRHRHASFHEFVLAQADAHLWGTPTASRIEIGPADVRPLQAYPRDFPVLLARLPCTEREQMEGATLIPPLSLIQLHSRLAAEAIPVTVVDLAAEAVVQGVTHPDRSPDPETIARFCQDRLCLEARRQRGFSLAGLSVENTSALALAERLSAALEIAPHIVVGGRGVVSAAEVLERCPHVDFAVGGEGDWPLLLLVRALAGGMEPRAIPGLAQRVAGTTVAHPGAWHDLDLVAPPDLTWINRSFYPDTKFPFRGEPVVPYMFVHGCPYRCAFCGDWTGGLMRTRSPARVVSDLDRMRRELGQRNFLFLNTLLNSSPSYLGELLSAMASARLDIQWADSAKPRNLSADTLRELRRLGCVALTWGIDAATPHLCRRMDKGFDLEEASQIIRWSREAGIDNVVNLIAGLPHETDQDIRETIAWLERHRAFVSHVNLMPFQFIENSLLFVHPERYGIVKTADGRGFDEVDGLPWAEKQDQIMRSYNLIDRTTGDLGYCRVTGTGEPTLH